jgi:hypothetical protein
VEERPRRRKVWALLGALLFLLLLAAIALVIVLANSSSEDAKDDVTVTRCEPKGDGQPEASGRIQNGSSKTSNYVIRIDFNDRSGNTVSEGAVTVKSVESDSTAEWQLTGARDASGPVKCEINRVSRTNLPGQ